MRSGRFGDYKHAGPDGAGRRRQGCSAMLGRKSWRPELILGGALNRRDAMDAEKTDKAESLRLPFLGGLSGFLLLVAVPLRWEMSRLALACVGDLHRFDRLAAPVFEVLEGAMVLVGGLEHFANPGFHAWHRLILGKVPATCRPHP